MAVKTIKQTVTIDASPKEVYDALMDSKKHSKFTGSKAVIENRVGGKFSTYDGYASGKNLELVPGKKIVQTWTTTDMDQTTEITFSLKKQGSGTKLDFTQKNVPEDRYDDIAQGWQDWYWKPLKEMFKK